MGYLHCPKCGEDGGADRPTLTQALGTEAYECWNCGLDMSDLHTVTIEDIVSELLERIEVLEADKERDYDELDF